MEIRIGFDLMCECPAPTAMVLMLGTHPERARDIVAGEHFRLSSLEPVGRYLDSFGNVCARVVAPSGQSTFRGHAVARDHGEPDPVDTSAEEVPIARLPDDVMLYLMGSRYCETDELVGFAWSRFGHLAPGWGRVQAIVDLVHRHLKFNYGLARPTRTAMNAYNERTGVCRDQLRPASVAAVRCRDG